MKSYGRFIEISDRLTAIRVAQWAQGRQITFISPVDCAALMGFPWWNAIISELDVASVIDCGDSANLAATSLRGGGHHDVVFQGNAAQRAALIVLAQICGAEILSERPEALMLKPEFSEHYQQHLLSGYLDHGAAG